MAHLEFKSEGELEWSVWEVGVVVQRFGARKERRDFWAGVLRFGTGVNEGWHFLSSDDSMDLNLGPNVARAKQELRRMYADGQRKAKESDKRSQGQRQERTHRRRQRTRVRRR